MKNMKKTFLLIFMVVLYQITAKGQNPCNLINSVTLNASSNQMLGAITYGGPNGVISNWSGCDFLQQNWSYIAYTKDQNNNYSLFINGVLVKSGTYQNLPYSWPSVRIGTDLPTSSASYFNGKVDDLRISNRVRTLNEIQTHYNLNAPFINDPNTIGLYNFNQTSGTSINSIVGPVGIGHNTSFVQGYFSNAIDFNGSNGYADIPLDIPESNLTVEFWIYVDSLQGSSDWVINYANGVFNGGFELLNYNPNYTWSTGATGNSVTVNPSQMPYVWVTDGNCTDTVWFNSQSATIYDTTYVTVTDTLLINTNVSGVNPPNNTNTIKIYPNPSNTNITIDYGNFSIMNGYQLKIENSIGQQVFQTFINHSTDNLNIGTWGGNGLYFVKIIDTTGNLIDVRKIVIQ